MRIAITPDGGKEVVLAELGGRVITTVQDYEEVPARDIQTVKYFRARFRKHIDRGNLALQITFGVSRLHEDVRDAEIFLLEHPQTVPGSGLVTITASGRNGRRAERYIQAAVVLVLRCKHGGATTYHQYQILGGEVISKKPLPL